MTGATFELTTTDGAARVGKVSLRTRQVATPAFMPVGTYGTVKAVTPEELVGIGTDILVANTYHLMLRPGTEIVAQHGGLHGFMNWPGAILTDSGGFQVFSLGARRKITEAGVEFRSPIDGAKVWLDPEKSMQVQAALGADIFMAFDECTPFPATEREAQASLQLTSRWAQRCREVFLDERQALFGIIQGRCLS